MNKLRTEFSTEIVCSFFPKCPGCKKQKDVQNPPIWQKLKEFFLLKKIPIHQALEAGEIVFWRSKVKLAVRGTVDFPKIGLFEEGSHDIVDIVKCPLHYPVIDEACSLLRQEIKKYRIIPYQETNNTGRLRYLQMMVNRKDLTVQVVFVFNGEELLQNELLFLDQIQKKFSWHSIWVNFLSKKTNTILGRNWRLIGGQKDFWQEIGGISFCFHPSCFSQANLFIFEKMIAFIDEIVPPSKNLLELYSGVGCIGLLVAHKADKVVFVESSPFAKESFEKTLSKMDKKTADKCMFYELPAEEGGFSWNFDVILVDPPRKGLSKKCKQKIFSSSARQVIYVSCGPQSFMRDCEEFLENGWIVSQSRGFLLFPGADHVELVVSFIKLPT